ncbi:MAG TPA: cupin domain-containing protein [Pirellulaceae bacterium]|nr:cupin domain-containing protein [Pirellulaceae bacterium]
MKIIRGESIPYSPASHENPERPGVLKRVLAGKSELQVGRVQMVNWSWLKSGQSFRSHYHQDMQEIFIITHGQTEMSIDGTNVSLAPGDAVIVDPGEIHSMQAVGDEDVFYVVFGISSDQGGRTVVVEP